MIIAKMHNISHKYSFSYSLLGMKLFKNKVYYIILLSSMWFSLVAIPFCVANPIPLPWRANTLFQSGIYSTGYPAHLKSAYVELNCYSDMILGYGQYEIVNLNETTYTLPIFFSHFYFYDIWFYYSHYDYDETINSVKINETAVEFSYNCSYNPCENMTSEECYLERRNMISFNATIGPLQTIDVEIEWSYNPAIMEDIFITGYSIYSEGWNRSIDYEEVLFKFHSDKFYRKNQICTYISNESYHEYAGIMYNPYSPFPCNYTLYDSDYCSISENTLVQLRDICNKTTLGEENGYKYFSYSDTNITNDCYIIVINPFVTSREVIKIVFFSTIGGIGGTLTIMLIPIIIKKVHKRRTI